MLTLPRRLLALFLVIAMVTAGLPVPPARASLSTCTADSSPHQVAPNSTTDIGFTFQNTDANPVNWMRVTVPSLDYSIVNVDVSGWSVNSPGGTTTYFTGGTLNPGDSISFTIQTLAGNTESSPADWGVSASDDSGGSGAISCDGTRDIAIVGQVTIPYELTNVHLSSLGTTSVVVTWDTNKPANSRVDYGMDVDYGSAGPVGGSLVTSHSVTLSGLSPNTSYHYMVTSKTAGDAETASSGDNTFLTADQATVIEETGGGGGGGVGAGGGLVTTPSGVPTETEPPTVSFTTQLAAVYKTVPKIEGRAADNDAVASVEYSTDGGKNWTDVDAVTATTVTTGRGKKKKTTTSTKEVTFSFTPVILDDGNYPILARATDPSGNRAMTAPVVLVIDRLPPRFGSTVVMVGPQQLLPDSDGTLVLPAGVDFKVNVSLVGGPISTTLKAKAGSSVAQSFSLAKGAESGLWLGILSFKKPGRYQLTGEALDGAGNRNGRTVAVVEVVSPVHVQADAKVLKGVRATLYYLNPEDHDWSVWDGATYGQENPRVLGESGNLSLLVPPGEYYLKLAVAGGLDTLTRSFKVERPTPLTGTIVLGKSASLRLGPVTVPLPWTQLAEVPVRKTAARDSGALNVRLPLVNLPTTAGKIVSPVEWYGKPTVLAVITTWAPSSAEQLKALAELQAAGDVNAIALAEEQRAETVAAYLRISGTSLEAVADPDGLLSDALSVPGIPVLYFIDRHGIIKKVMVGSRSASEMLTTLSQL